MTKIVGVRFRPVGKLYYFSPKDLDLQEGEGVIVETARGVEFGRVVLSPREIEDEMVTQPLKPVLRKATNQDYLQAERQESRKESAMIEVGKIIEEVVGHTVGTSAYDEAYHIGDGEGFFVFGFEILEGIVGVGVCLEVCEILHVGVFAREKMLALLQLSRD